MAKALNSGSTATETSETYRPEFSSVDHGHGYPHIPVTPPFVLVFSPKRWMIHAGKLVPQLSKQPLENGVNLVEINRRDGRIKLARLRARLEEEDRKVIPYEWAPDSNSYIQSVDTRVGPDLHTSYISVWESAYAGDDRTYPDETAYAEWLDGLVSSGKLPACPPHRVRRMLEQARAKLVAAQAGHRKAPSSSLALRVEALEAEVSALEKAAESKPAAKRKAPSKAAKPAIEG